MAAACFNPEQHKQIIGIITQRLHDGGENWRHVYKALLLLEHLVKHGPQAPPHPLSTKTHIAIIAGYNLCCFGRKWTNQCVLPLAAVQWMGKSWVKVGNRFRCI